MPLNDGIATQSPNSVFRWPSGVTLTAIDELALILPGKVIGESETIQSVLEGSDDMQLKLEFFEDGNSVKFVIVKLQPEMWVRVTRACEAKVISFDGEPKRIRVS